MPFHLSDIWRTSRIVSVFVWISFLGDNFIKANPMIWSRLRSNLLDNGYDITAIPFANNQEPLSVTINANLQIVTDLDQKRQVLRGISLFGLMWTDSRLIWSPEDYGNITSLSIPSTQIWSPSLYLANSASADHSIPMHPATTNAFIQSNGAVSIDTSVVHSSFCFLDLTWFPYDELNCSLVVASPNIDKSFLTLEPGNFINSKYLILNHEWNIVSFNADNIQYLTSVGVMRAAVIFSVGLERLPHFYLSSIVLPILLLELIGIATFWIPPKSGERISACLSTILGLTVFQIVMADVLPQISRNEQRPVIFDHASIAFILLVTIMFASLITTNISYCTRPVKNSIVKTLFFRIFATLVFMRKAGRQKMRHHGNRIDHQDQKDSEEVVTYVQQISGQIDKGENSNGKVSTEADMSNSENDAYTDMELIAAILDRLFFLFFILLHIVLSVNNDTLAFIFRAITR